MFSFVQIRKLIMLVGIILSITAFQNCSKNTVGKAAVANTNVYDNPASVHFTAENYVFMLRTTYNNFTLVPSQEDIDSILNASDDDAAKTAYETAIDKLIDSGDMKPKLKLIARQILGTEIVLFREEASRYPENLFAYIIDEGLPMSEFILAQYVIHDDGSKHTEVYERQPQQFGPPVEEQAGYTTGFEYLTLYLNQFAFKMDREIIGVNLCDTAPYSKFDSFAWKIDQVNNTYRVADDGTSCYNCHAKKEPLRGAWHYINANKVWDPTVNGVQGTDQYGQEQRDPGRATLEPRNPDDTAMNENTAESTMYKFKEGGANILTPRLLAQQVVKEPRFATCWTERLLAIFLNLDQGHPGQGFVPPNNFAANEAQAAFLSKWTDAFNEKDQVAREWIRDFLKDPDYLILSYSPNGNN